MPVSSVPPDRPASRRPPTVLLALLAAALAVSGPSAAARLRFGGWMDVYPEVSQVLAHPELFDSLSFGMYGITRDGGLKRSTRVPSRDAVMAWARRHGVQVYLTLGAAGGGDLPAGITGEAATRCLQAVVALCAREGFAGVDVDIEELSPQARGVYERFIEALRDRLAAARPPLRLAVTLQCYQNAADERGSFLDYGRLAALADEVRVMHYTCPWGEPGPIMPRPAFAESVAYARSRIPKEKYVAALPWYGNDWNLADKSSEDILWEMTDRATGILGPREMVPRFGGRFAWREPEGELFYTYTRDGARHEVWMPDARTFAWMIDVVKRAGAAGIYVYQLEYASPEYLKVVARALGR